MIRAAKDKDIPSVIELAREFWKHTLYKNEEFQPEMVEAMFKSCMENNLAFVFSHSDGIIGFICAIKGPLLANVDIMIATELAWWVKPKYRASGAGIFLLRALEKEALSQGVKYFNMVVMESSLPEKVKKIYSNLGYNKNESVYTKIIR